MDCLDLSPLSHTWLLDLDGTVLKHNGYKLDGEDGFLPGMKSFVKGLPSQDMIIILTSREESYAKETEAFLRRHGVRYDYIIYGVPFGERILINDCKPSGLQTAVAVSVVRDVGNQIEYQINESR